MSLSCPIGPEFDALVFDLKSTAAARAAVALNNGNIPDAETAQQLLDKTLQVNPEEKINKSSESFTLKKMVDEQIMLELLKNKILNTKIVNKGQVKAINGLLKTNVDFQKALIKSIETGVPVNKNSVTNLIGSNFTGDPTQFEKTKRFGIFIHDFADKIIKIANEENKRISDLAADYKFFSDELAAFYTKNYFNLENVSDDQLHDMARDVIEKIAALKGTEHIIIPELTVISKGRNEENFIIGRIDLLAINKHGKFKVFDFKTKKVENLINTKDVKFGEVQEVDNVNEVLLKMVNANFPTLTDADQIVAKKASPTILKATDHKRTVYDTWSLQLMLYENMLKQAGLEKAEDSSIIALFYQMDDDNKAMLARAIHKFDTQDYYEYALGMSENLNESQINKFRKKLIALKKAVEFEIPTGEEVVSEKEQKEVEPLEFLPTIEQDQMIQSLINGMYDSQISDANSKRENLKYKHGNKVLYKVYDNQVNTLEKYKEIYNKTPDISDRRMMHNFALVHEVLNNEMDLLSEGANIAISKYKENPTHTIFSRQTKIINQIYNRTHSNTFVIDLLDNIVRDAMLNPENKLDQNSDIVKKINALKTKVQVINSIFSEMALKNGVKSLQSLGDKTFERVKEFSKEPINIEIKLLQKQIDKLKEGKQSIFNTLKGGMLTFLSKTYKDEIQEKLSDPDKHLWKSVEDLELQILKLQMLKDQNYDENSLIKYINGVTIPGSAIYVGMQNPMNSTGIISGMMMDEFIASASNSDMMVASITTMLKDVKLKAIENVQKDFAIIQFDQKKSELLKKYDLKDINQMMSEIRTTKVFNPKTGQDEDKQGVYFIKPTSNAYDNIYKNFDNQLSTYRKEIRDLKSGFSSKLPGTPEFQELEKQYYDKIDERNKFTEKHVQWLIDHTSLPYKNEFYEYQKLLPFEIRNEIQKKYHEMEIIKATLDISSEEFLSDEDVDRLDQLEYEIRQIRQEAKKLNPDYEKYIDMFNQLYKFSEDTRRYELAYQNAKIKYELDDPEKWKKWQEKNTIIKPSDDWYKSLSDLYDERNHIYNMYYGENPAMSSLMEERKNLLAPHKVMGELKIKNLDDTTIQRLDQIQDEINELTENKPKSKVKIEQHDAQTLSEISMVIDKISKLSLAKDYEEQFKNKTRNLENKYTNYINASVEYQLEKDSENIEKIENLKNDYLRYEKDFFMYEAEYKDWYENFHAINYKSIRDDEYYFKDNKIPKSFNYQRTVSDEMYSTYMEEKPGAKYRIKTLRKDEYYDVNTGEELTEDQLDDYTEEELKNLVANGSLYIKEGVMNKDFLKSADGIPMPKNIVKVDGAYLVKPGMENMTVTDPITGEVHPAVNASYMKLMQNQEVFDFYNSLMDMYFNLQNKVDGRRTGYRVPSKTSSMIENLSTLGVGSTISKQVDTFIDKEIRAYGSHQDYINNSWGALGDVTRISGVNELPLNLQTTDSIGALMHYAGEAHYNTAMQDVAPVANTTIQYLEKLSKDIQNKIQAKDYTFIDPLTNKKSTVDWDKRFKELNKVIEILKYEKRKFVNLQANNPEEKNRKLTKIVKQVMSYTSFIRMGFDVVNQTKNYFSGNVQAFIAAGNLDDGSHYTKENYAWAQQQFFGTFIPNYFADFGKINDVSESTMLYRKFNPHQKDFDHFIHESSGSAERKLTGIFINPIELGYMIQDKGDTAIGIVVMYSILDNYKYNVFTTDPATGKKIYKLNPDGTNQTVKGHEVYYQDANKLLQIRQDIEFTAEDEKFIRNIIYSEMRKAQGNYASWDQTKKEENITGKLIFYYRKYLVPQFLNRFGYLRTNWEGAEVTIGYWRALSKLYKAYGFVDATKYFLNFGKQGTKAINPAEIGKLYTKSISHARRDGVAMALLTVLAYATLQYVRRKDDDDEELGMLEGNAVRLMWGIQGETTAMFPLGGGSQEYIKNFTSASTYLRELTAIKKVGEHTISTIGALTIGGGEEPDPEYDSAVYQSLWKDAYYNKKSGAYEKGDMKLVKDFVDLTGWKNFRDTFDPNYKIDILKRNQ